MAAPQMPPVSGHVFRVERARGPVWYAKHRLPDGRQAQRKIGPAWTSRGRPAAGYVTAATRTKGTYLAAQYQRLRPRIGHGRALGAVKHSMLVAYWHMFTTGETYRDLGGDYFARRDPERATKRLVAKLQELGHSVTLQPATA